jgi:preprotein translocase subunit SecE
MLGKIKKFFNRFSKNKKNNIHANETKEIDEIWSKSWLKRSKLEKKIFFKEKRNYWKNYFFLLLKDLLKVKWLKGINAEKKLLSVLAFIFVFIIYFSLIEFILQLIFKHLT